MHSEHKIIHRKHKGVSAGLVVEFLRTEKLK